MNPRIVVNLGKLRENIHYLTEKIIKENISITAVTKVYNADPKIIDVFEEFSEIEYLGDSRIENIKSYEHSNKKKILIRIPMQSEVEEVVKYADISFNSELRTVEMLNEAARRQNKIHQVLFMIDLGDLREGFFDEDQLREAVKATLGMKHIQLIGLGVNLTCYGAIIPDHHILSQLIQYKDKIEQEFKLELPMISGGNSSSLYLLDHEEESLPKGITNLRIGEAFLLGRETAWSQEYAEIHQDVFTLKAEIVELKEKPSYPIGKVGVDAFGNKPIFEDKGPMLRGILAIGKQDVNPNDITPLDSDLEVIGASSDHLIVDFSRRIDKYQVGDTVDFALDYGSVLSTFTSKYVKKEYR